MTAKDHIAIGKETVIKTGCPEAVIAEAARTQQASEIGRSSGLFRAPRVLSVDAEGGSMEMERILGLGRMQPFAAYSRPDDLRWERLGVILAVIHRELNPANCVRTPLPDPWSVKAAEDVHIHGDFGFANIFHRREADEIVVLDWAPSRRMVGERATVGPRWFDIAWFLANLFFLPRRLVLPRRLEAKAERFLAGYASRSGCPLDDDVITRFTRQAHRIRLETLAASPARRVFYVRSSARLGRYLARGLQGRKLPDIS